MDKIDLNTLNKMYETRELKEIIDTIKKLIKIIYIERIISTKDIDEIESINPEQINMNISKNHKRLLIEYKENLEQIKKISTIQNLLKHNKKELIEQIKKQIETLNEKHFLRLKEIIQNEKINKEALSFAIELLENENKIKPLIKQIREEKDELTEIAETNVFLRNLIKNKKRISILLDEINEANSKNETTSVLNIIKFIKLKKEKKKTKEEKIQELINVIYEDYGEKENYELKIYCFEKLTNIKIIYDKINVSKPEEFNIENCKKIKNQLEKEFNIIINYIKEQLKDKKVKYVKIPNQICDKKLKEYVYRRQNNYVYYIINIINPNKNKENTLFYKIINLLRIVEQIENNNYNLIDDLMPKSTYEIDLLKTLTCDTKNEDKLKETIEIQNHVLSNSGVKTIRK